MDGTTSTPPRPSNTGQIAVGVTLLGMGLLLLAGRSFLPDISLARSWWPLMLILFGAARAACARSARDGDLRSGTWLMMVGVWALVSDWHLFGFTFGTSWPLLVMGSGMMIVWRALETRGAAPRREP